MPPYRYQPLQHSDSVRILVLHPSPDTSDPITCTIRQRRLSDESPGYEAISYTWGDAMQQYAIHFRGSTRKLIVGKNCHDALRYLRLGHEDRLLWLDAICINQDNLIERAQQVRIMNDVYSRALNVVVFLGEQVTDCLALFEELAAADELLRLGKNCDRPRPSDTIIGELETLFERPWFKRVWVLQEVCAKRSIQIMCGSASASFEALKALYFGYKNTVVGKKNWPVALKWILRPPEIFPSPQLSLWNRLYYSRYCLATDPRDKIFALKSLVGPEHRQMDYLIDYIQSLEHCFTEVARFLLPVLGLRLLVAARFPHNRDMSSWIPDWSQNFSLYFKHFDFFDLNGLLDEFGLFVRSSGKPQYTIRSFGADQKRSPFLELAVTGIQYARIIERSPILKFCSLEDAKGKMEGLYASLENLRALVEADTMCNDVTMCDILGERILYVMSLLDPWMLHNFLTQTGPLDLYNEQFHISFESAEWFSDTLQQCRINLLDNDELVIAPEAIQCGDVICILSGTVSACALRSDPDGSWSLVSGDCYLSAEESIKLISEGSHVTDDYIEKHRDRVQEFRIR